MMKIVRYIFFMTLFLLELFIFSMTSGAIRRYGVKKIPEITGKLGEKIGAKVAWPIASRFLGTLSPYLLHIGTLGTMIQEKIAQPGKLLSVVGGVGATTFFLYSMKRLKNKRKILDEKIRNKKNELEKIKQEIELLKKPAKSAEPKNKNISINIAVETERLQGLIINQKETEGDIAELEKNRNDLIKLFFNIAAPLSKTMLFVLFGGLSYGLQYSGSLIEWIGRIGIDPAWGGRFAK